MIDNAIYQPSEADITIIGLDFYSTCGEQGHGPTLIRQSVNSFSSYENGYDVFDELKICDLGDLKAKSYSELKKKVLKQPLKKPVIFGGEHLVTLPVIEALKPKKVLIFDAHADYYDKYEGNEHSYATVSRRISELVDELVIAGVRDITRVEAEALKNSNVRLVSVEQVPKVLKGDDWYVSIDLDVLDPIYCPEVSTPIPLGTNYETLVKVLNKVCLNHRIIGLDVVELTAKHKGLSSVNAGGIVMNYLKTIRRCK